jgi:hypothetical protein
MTVGVVVLSALSVFRSKVVFLLSAESKARFVLPGS